MSQYHLKLFINGIVQGVGFRPHVYNMANSFGLKGYVLNDSRGVTIEAEAPEMNLRKFRETLISNPPPLAQIQSVTEEWGGELQNYPEFFIKKSSDTGSKTVLISPDIATCDDCLEEMGNPGDRRYDYPFINCTNCGPRFTIITDVPYDRHNTSMKDFPLCDFCRAQYEDPSNRRFHAQPVACPVCGPQIRLLDNRGEVVCENPVKALETATELLREGAIIAVKGLGGYHLSADAENENAVHELRCRKFREDKPFAVMFPNMESVERECHINEEESKLLKSRQAPIVLLKKRKKTNISPSVAPGNNYLGVMLPYTPLHHLVMEKFASPLVMTSGNVSEEPISYNDEEALSRLGKIAGFCLLHNRPVHTRCDDTVTRVFRNREYPLRRSRGYAPNPLILKHSTPLPILAVGGELKNTFCFLRNNNAFLSHHIGDLENIETFRSFEEGINHYKRLFDLKPELIVYDLHLRYLSTQYALNSPVNKKIGVQHHHAHIVSCMADNEISGEVIGIALDGVGYGSDGKLWGCEFMKADERNFTRYLHLRYMKLPGGEKAIREPWRGAMACLKDVCGESFHKLNLNFLKDIGEQKINFIEKMLEKNISCPEISSAGRLFDAAASLMGIRNFCNFEGQAAVEMEMRASGNETGEYPVMIIEGDSTPSPGIIDYRPILEAIIHDLDKGVEIPVMAGKFHNTMARMVLEGAKHVSRVTCIKRVVLSGGVFQNMLLLEKSLAMLENAGFETFIHCRVPTNDGGISLGQAVSAMAAMKKE